MPGPGLRQYFSQYRIVSEREGEKGEKRSRRVKLSPPAPTASAIGPCPTTIQLYDALALEVYPPPFSFQVLSPKFSFRHETIYVFQRKVKIRPEEIISTYLRSHLR